MTWTSLRVRPSGLKYLIWVDIFSKVTEAEAKTGLSSSSDLMVQQVSYAVRVNNKVISSYSLIQQVQEVSVNNDSVEVIKQNIQRAK